MLLEEALASAKQSRGARGLALGLLVAAVLLIIGLKALRTTTGGGLKVAEGAAPAVVPTLAASDAAPSARPSTSAYASDPWPASPEAQVEWVLRNGKSAIILFHSTNCKPCIAMSALVEQVRPAYASKVIFIDVVTNNSANANLVRRAGIRSIPTTFFVAASGEGRGYVGLMKEEDLRAELDKLARPE